MAKKLPDPPKSSALVTARSSVKPDDLTINVKGGIAETANFLFQTNNLRGKGSLEAMLCLFANNKILNESDNQTFDRNVECKSLEELEEIKTTLSCARNLGWLKEIVGSGTSTQKYENKEADENNLP